MSDSPSPPPAPDYAGAAAATATGNLDAARIAAKANRVSQYTPYGNMVYTPGVNGDQDQWRSDITLSPTGQKLLDNQNQQSIGVGNYANEQLGQVTGQGPFQYAGDVSKVMDDAYAQQTSRLDPQWNQREQAQQTQLVNQGLRPGTEAYDNAMRDFNFARNDAYSQARTNAANLAPQTYQLAQAAYDQPFNRLQALRGGSQVTNPAFNTAPQQQTTAGANQLGAMQSQAQYNQGLYNADVAANNSFNQGLMGLAGTAATFFM